MANRVAWWAALSLAGCPSPYDGECAAVACAHRVVVPNTVLTTCFAADPLPDPVAGCQPAREDGSDCEITLFLEVDHSPDCCSPPSDVDRSPPSCTPPDIRRIDEAVNGAYDFDVFMVGECGQDAYTLSQLECRFLETGEAP